MVKYSGEMFHFDLGNILVICKYLLEFITLIITNDVNTRYVLWDQGTEIKGRFQEFFDK
jgi:hypothetical protein